MIVFNGDDFLKQTLDSIYPFAHEIVIIEGADKNAMCLANPDGSSTDKTVEIIKNYPDKYKKIRLIQGKWNNKTEEQNEYLKFMSGDYIWHVDDDEIYKHEDIKKVINYLENNPSITAVSFYFINFFKGLNYVTKKINSKEKEVWRIFKYKKGSYFTTHRPPTMFDPETSKIMNKENPLQASILAGEGIFFYHLSYITNKQIREKMIYYTQFRLNEGDAGIPFVKTFSFFRPIQKMWLRFWHIKLLIPLRKIMDRRWFNYEYINLVWNVWDQNPLNTEKHYSVLPTPNFKTELFNGELPESLKSHQLYKLNFK